MRGGWTHRATLCDRGLRSVPSGCEHGRDRRLGRRVPGGGGRVLPARADRSVGYGPARAVVADRRPGWGDPRTPALGCRRRDRVRLSRRVRGEHPAHRPARVARQPRRGRVGARSGHRVPGRHAEHDHPMGRNVFRSRCQVRPGPPGAGGRPDPRFAGAHEAGAARPAGPDRPGERMARAGTGAVRTARRRPGDGEQPDRRCPARRGGHRGVRPRRLPAGRAGRSAAAGHGPPRPRRPERRSRPGVDRGRHGRAGRDQRPGPARRRACSTSGSAARTTTWLPAPGRSRSPTWPTGGVSVTPDGSPRRSSGATGRRRRRCCAAGDTAVPDVDNRREGCRCPGPVSLWAYPTQNCGVGRSNDNSGKSSSQIGTRARRST